MKVLFRASAQQIKPADPPPHDAEYHEASLFLKPRRRASHYIKGRSYEDMELTCPNCGRDKASDVIVGDRLECESCGLIFQITGGSVIVWR